MAGRGRCLRAVAQAAPGRLRASCPPVLRPVRGVLPLDWDRQARVTPREPRPRKPGPKLRQDKTWREPRRSAERRARPQQMVLRKRTICGALPRPWRRRVATSVLRGADSLTLASVGAPPPLVFFGGETIRAAFARMQAPARS